MVIACTAAGVPLIAGATPANHPSYARAKELIGSDAIGDVVSIEAEAPASQKPHWMYFVDDMPLWVVGVGDRERRDTGSDEFLRPGACADARRSRCAFQKRRRPCPCVRHHRRDCAGQQSTFPMETVAGRGYGERYAACRNTVARSPVRGRVQRGVRTDRPDRLLGGQARRAQELRTKGGNRVRGRNRPEGCQRQIVALESISRCETGRSASTTTGSASEISRGCLLIKCDATFTASGA